MTISRHVAITRPQWSGKEVEKNLTRLNQVAIGSYLKAARLELGMSQEVAGKPINVQKTAISAMETGIKMLGPDKMVQLGEVYGLDQAEYGRFLLRYTNPWQYGLIFGTDDPELRADLGLPNKKLKGAKSTVKAQA